MQPTATRILLRHQTRYQYAEPVFLGTHLIRLRPAPHTRTTVDLYSLRLTPEQGYHLHWQHDAFGNHIARVDFTQPVSELVVDVSILLVLTPVDPFDFYLDDYAQSFPFQYEPRLQKDLCAYLERSEPGMLFGEWMNGLDKSPKGTLDFLVGVNRMVNQRIAYTTREEAGIQSGEESLQLGSGSCRDSAWLLVQLLRSLGLAARFVSGYLVQLASNEAGAAPQEDQLALHAWTEVFLPGAGWVGLDPTGGLLAAEGHIPLACTATPESAAAVTGKSGVTDTRFSYTSSILRL